MVAGMLMNLRDLRAIYEVLFRDGVMVAKKDKRPQTKHPEIEGVSNLQVIRAMVSLKSRGCVKETFAWRHFYWYLTNEGIVYLRDYLHLPPEIVPASLQRVRKPASTLAIAHRAARVQSVEGPTSYVPKPGRRGEGESQEALAERQGYRHKMMGPGERESYSERTPRFRGRPLAAEPVRPKASWEMEVQPQPLSRKGDSFRSGTAVLEESRVKRVGHQHCDVSSQRPVTKSQERTVSEVQKENAPISVQVERAASKQDASPTSVSSKTALPLAVAAVAEATGAAPSKIQPESPAPKTNKEKFKTTDETNSMKSSKMGTSKSTISTLPFAGFKEEKTKKSIVDPVHSAEVKAIAEMAADNVKPQAFITVAQKSSKFLTDTSPTVIKAPANKDVKEENTKNVSGEPVTSAEVKPIATKESDKVKLQTVSDTATATTVITKHIKKDVKEEKLNNEKVNEKSAKPAEVNVPVESKIHQEKVKKTAKLLPTKGTSKPQHDNTTGGPVFTAVAGNEFSRVKIIEEPEMTSVAISAKPQTCSVPQKTAQQLVAESSVLEVKTTTTQSAHSSASDTKPVNVNKGVTAPDVITTQEETDVKLVPHIKKDEIIVTEEVCNVSAKGPKFPQKDSSSLQVSQSAAITELVKETKQVVEGSSKSKRKKKKSPGEISETSQNEDPSYTKLEKEKISIDKPSVEVAENTLQPKPVISSDPLDVCTSRSPPAGQSKTGVEIVIDGGRVKEVSHQTDEETKTKVPNPKHTVDQSMSEIAPPKSDQIPPVPLVEVFDDAQVKEKAEGSSTSERTQGSLRSNDKSNTKLPLTEPVKSEELTVTKVETVMVQNITQVELLHTSPKKEESSSAALSGCHEPTVETKSPISTEKPAEESSKARKKGKKQAQAPVSDNINTKPVFLPEAEALPSSNITSLLKATVKDCPVTVSELADVKISLKTTPERICSEETRQAAAVLSEAPADKGGVEPALVFAEKIKREVPKPKTSSTAREEHAPGELASAAPVAAAEAVVAPAQASPLTKQEEPPKVAQHSASQAAERCTEKGLSVLEASKQEEEKKRNLEEDTPSASVTQVAAQPDQPHLGDTCESTSSDVEEAAMRKKIVVVEEIVEVKQVLSPQADGQQSPPPPVQPEVEGEELDLDVLEAIAIERALLSGAAGGKVQGASPEEDWDHSLEEPEDKTWPNFIEGLFACAPTDLLPAFSCSFASCDGNSLASQLIPLFEVWEVLGGKFDVGSVAAHPHCHVLKVFYTLKKYWHAVIVLSSKVLFRVNLITVCGLKLHVAEPSLYL